jgi:glutamate formiminotransferase
MSKAKEITYHRKTVIAFLQNINMRTNHLHNHNHLGTPDLVPLSLLDEQKLTTENSVKINSQVHKYETYHRTKITMQEILVTTPTHLLREKEVNNRIK